MTKLAFNNLENTKIYVTTGAPKLINSDLFLEKRATVPIKTLYRYCSTFFQNQIAINKFWGTCDVNLTHANSRQHEQLRKNKYYLTTPTWYTLHNYSGSATKLGKCFCKEKVLAKFARVGLKARFSCMCIRCMFVCVKKWLLTYL